MTKLKTKRPKKLSAIEILEFDVNYYEQQKQIEIEKMGGALEYCCIPHKDRTDRYWEMFHKINALLRVIDLLKGVTL